jgi:hypothetical protein
MTLVAVAMLFEDDDREDVAESADRSSESASNALKPGRQPFEALDVYGI